jgi:hypothetical protein
MKIYKSINSLSKNIIPVGCFAVISFRILQIWLNPIDDYDTSSFVLMVQGGFYPESMFFFDIAHPGLLAGLIKLCQLVLTQINLPPIFIWSMLITLGFLFACVCLFYLMRALRCSILVALVACLVFALSPAVSDVASRSEENILFHGLFILSIWACLNYLRNKSTSSVFFVFISALSLAAQHAQPFVIVCGGLFLLFCSELYKSKHKIDNTAAIAFKVFVIYSSTGILYYLIMHSAFYNPMIVKAYSNNFYSIFHNDSFLRYLKAYLLFAQGFVLTGEFPVNYTTIIGVDPRTSIWLLGFIVLFITFFLSLRRSFVDFFVWPALGFVFLYEPSASERWDTFIIAMIISLLSRFSVGDHLRDDSGRCYSLAIVVCILLFNVYALKGQVIQIFNTIGAREFMVNEIGMNKVVFGNLDSARLLISHSPRETRFRNIDGAIPQKGDAIYLKDGAAIVKSKFNLSCTSTKVPDLCLISQ